MHKDQMKKNLYAGVTISHPSGHVKTLGYDHASNALMPSIASRPCDFGILDVTTVLMRVNCGARRLRHHTGRRLPCLTASGRALSGLRVVAAVEELALLGTAASIGDCLKVCPPAETSG